MKSEIILTFFFLQISNVFGAFTSRISQRKCLDYEAASPFTFGQNGLNPPENDADPKEFSFMAKVYIGNSNDYYYNGILVSENFVLTLGNYVIESGTNVVLGDYINRADIRSRRFNVIQHFKSSTDDLTLLKLNNSVELNEFIRPVCLMQPESNVLQPAIEVAWGIRSRLRKEKWDVLTNTRCNVTDRTDEDETRMCASKEKSDCDNWFEILGFQHLYVEGCALLNGGRHKELVGVKMRTAHCNCGMGEPEEFARVSAYIDWIEEVVWDVQFVSTSRKNKKSKATGIEFSSICTAIVLMLTALLNCC